ncbi:MAG: hypothetical protein FI716_10145 [SAR202 cluster bacterium]|nr:hypothetical protein [SAR202 cluster bacterium]
MAAGRCGSPPNLPMTASAPGPPTGCGWPSPGAALKRNAVCGCLWLRNPDGVNLVHLTEENDFSPVWSPNGKHIVFVRVFEGNSDLYLASRLKDGTWQDDVELTRLTQHEEDDLAPAWSPDGDTIAFVTFRDGNGEIYIMESDGSRQLRLTTNEADDLDPVWSPNGKQIAFVSHLYGPGEIFIMDDDGENQLRLTTNDAEDHSPDW